MSILSIPEELFEYILLNINDREDILRVSRVCKLFNKFINTSKVMHLNNVYDTKFLCFGNVNNSWKSKVSTLCMKNIFNSKYETIRFKFETCIQKLVLTNIYIDELDITNCILIKKLIVTNAVVKSIVGVDTAKELVKLDVSMSTFNNIKISSYLKNLNLNYTIIQSISIPVENSLVKFQAKNCNFNLINNDAVNCLPLSYSKLVTFSIKSKGVWDTTFGSSINSICIDNSSVKNINFLNGCSTKLKCLEISNSRIKNIEKIRGYVYSVQNICLRENRINNFDFIKKYKELVILEIVETTNKYPSEFIHELENLKKLRLSGSIIFNIKNINSKAPLEVLYLDIYILENIKLIAGFRAHLKKLNISAYDYLDIEPISECINLVKLRINNKRFSSFGDDFDILRPLIKLDKLKVLDMNGVFLKMKQLDVFNEMANLKLVNLPIKFYYKIKRSDKIRYSFKEHWIGFSKKKHIYYRKECNEIRLLLT